MPLPWYSWSDTIRWLRTKINKYFFCYFALRISGHHRYMNFTAYRDKKPESIGGRIC